MGGRQVIDRTQININPIPLNTFTGHFNTNLFLWTPHNHMECFSRTPGILCHFLFINTDWTAFAEPCFKRVYLKQTYILPPSIFPSKWE